MKIFACLPAVLLGLASFAAYADGTDGRDIRPGTVTGLEGSFLLPLQERDSVLIADQLRYGFRLEDVKEGTKDADVIYTDVWVSMGEPDEVWEERIRELTPYKVTKEVMANAKESAIFLHCLPAFHDLKTKIGKEMGERFGITDMEVTDEVFESPQSKVFDEAENRMHTIKAVMAATLETTNGTELA